MNTDQIIRMIMRLFGRRLMNKGINAGLNRMSGGGKTPKEMTQDERDMARQSKQIARRARQAAKVTRRMGRF